MTLAYTHKNPSKKLHVLVGYTVSR